MKNPLQSGGYCTCRQGQKIASVFSTYLICVFRTLLSINSKYTPIQHSLIVFLMEEHCILGQKNVSIIARTN
jgi:hypothetical protein